jgi:hypothetical protein
MTNLRRHLLGVIGGGFLGAALALQLFASTGDSRLFLVGLLTRTGALLVILWFALPNLTGLYRYFPKWVWLTAGLALAAAAIHRNLLLIVAVFFFVLVFFKIVDVFLRSPDSKRSDTKGKSSK